MFANFAMWVVAGDWLATIFVATVDIRHIRRVPVAFSGLLSALAWNALYTGLSIPINDMTNPNSAAYVPAQGSSDLLPRDTFRTVIAIAIILLTLGGWIYALAVPVDRFALAAQTKLWWIEQVVGFVLAIVCIGIVLRKRSFLTVAFWLTIYSLVFDIVRWYFEFKEGQPTIPIALILYALFIWRLQLARRAVVAGQSAGTV
jgi:hypothetical protein